MSLLLLLRNDEDEDVVEPPVEEGGTGIIAGGGARYREGMLIEPPPLRRRIPKQYVLLVQPAIIQVTGLELRLTKVISQHRLNLLRDDEDLLSFFS